MTYNLQAVIAELAAQFGIETGTLWDWLKSDGITSYAKAYVAYNMVYSILGCVIALIGLIMFVSGLVFLFKHENEELCFISLIIGGVVFVIATVSFVPTMANTIGWMASPEGMVIKQLVDTLSAS